MAVLTSTSSSAMAPVVAYRVLDELLGLEPFDGFADQVSLRRVRAGVWEARGPPRRARRSAAQSLDAYAGSTSILAYGPASSPSTRSPAWRLCTMDLSLAHRHYETFDLELDEPLTSFDFFR